jgi:hypothetical protein
MESYIIHCDELKPENIVSQIRNIKAFPAVVKVYDRTFTLATRDEAVILGNGIEIGFYVSLDQQDKV